MAPTTQQIIRYLKHDYGNNLQAMANYARNIALSSSLNPWSEPGAAANYAEAARLLQEEHEINQQPQQHHESK